MQFGVAAILFVAGAVLVRSAPQQININIEENEQSSIHDTDFRKQDYCKPKYEQSPIDIADFQKITCPNLVYKSRINNNESAKLENTGHTVKLMIKGTQPVLTGGPLKSDYTFEQLHFHWGKSKSKGSEHTRRGSQFHMEAHVVHYKTKYGSFAKASKKKDGLAIIGIFFEISPSKNAQVSIKDLDNQLLKPLATQLCEIPKAQNSVEKPATSLLEWLWPHVTPNNYFTYSGSLTTPPYSEVATWIVYETPIPMSENQIAEFQNLNPEGNFRKTQPLHGRKVNFCKS